MNAIPEHREDGWEELRPALEAAGFEPDFNVCASCGHHGGEHDLGNWCLVCPRPEMPPRPIEARLAAGWCYFVSMTNDEKWAHGVSRLAALAAARGEPGLREAALAEALRDEHDRLHTLGKQTNRMCLRTHALLLDPVATPTTPEPDPEARERGKLSKTVSNALVATPEPDQ